MKQKKSLYVYLKDQYGIEQKYRINGCVLPVSLITNYTYRKLVDDNPSLNDPDKFLRTISNEFNERYPFNAEWKGDVFHLYGGGRSDKVNRYLLEYLRENPTGTVVKFRILVRDNYKNL